MLYSEKSALLKYGGIIVICCLLYYCECKISTIKEELPHTIRQSFTTAIEQDLDKRFKEANIQHVMGYFRQNSNNSQTKGYTIMSKDTTEFIPADSAYINDEALKENSERQTILKLFNPIRPQSVDSFFQTELARQHIQAKTLVVSILDNKNKSYSDTDTTLLSSALHTDPVILGLKKEIRLQAFISFPKLRYLKITKGFLIGLLICIAGVMILKIIIPRKKNDGTEHTPAAVPAVPTIPDIPAAPLSNFNYPYRNCKKTKFKSHSLYEIEGVSFDFYEFELMIDSKLTNMTPQNRKILQTLLDAPDCFLNRKQLYARLWPGKAVNYNKLNKSVSRLREALHDIDPRLGLKTYFKNGYQIEIDKTKKDDRETEKDDPVIATGESRKPV